MNDSTSASEAVPRAASSRRTFLTRAAILGIVPLTLGVLMRPQRQGIAPVAKAGWPSAPVHGLECFVPLTGCTFVAAATASQPALALVLAKAEPLKHHRPGVAEQFSLRFTAPAGHPFESRIYQLDHPALGRLELFITSVGSAILHGEQQKGEAVINFAPRPA